jgi:hypothetical protein
MHCPPLRRVTLFFCLSPLLAHAQNFVNLDFSNNIQETNANYPNNSTLGPAYYAGLTLDFANVSAGIDARVSINYTTASGVSPGYEFVGYIPNYDSAASQPDGDLGVYYRSILGNTEAVTGGISYTISFYESGSNFMASATLSDVRILIYDHDGEPGQSESIRTFANDGFAGYQIGDVSGIHVHDEGDSWRFDAAGTDLPATSADGSFIAYYQNTSSIRFDLIATTEPTLPGQRNGIFAAFDGDLSLTGGLTTAFNPYVAVPEPGAALLTILGISMMAIRRKRF